MIVVLVIPEAKKARAIQRRTPCPWLVATPVISAGRKSSNNDHSLTQPQEAIMHIRSLLVVILLIYFLGPGPVPGKSELPHEFGELVPLYPSAQSIEIRYTRDSVTVQFATNDNYERVFGFYTKALKEAGWLILPGKSPREIKAEKLESGKDDITLTLTDASERQGHRSGFIIDLRYSGGRE